MSARALLLGRSGVAPPTGGGGGGGGGGVAQPSGQRLVPQDWFNHPDDPFLLRSRSPGNLVFWIADNAPGGGSGSEFSPWTLQEAVDRLGTSIPGGSWVVAKRGLNYQPVAITTGGTHRDGGMITFLAEWVYRNEPYERGTTGIAGQYERWFEHLPGSQYINWCGFHAEHTTLNDAYNTKADQGQVPATNPGTGGTHYDVWLSSNLFGVSTMNPGKLGFQMNNYQIAAESANLAPSRHIGFFNCTARGLGEGFGGYGTAPIAIVGCEAWDNAHWSPASRSGISCSWVGTFRSQFNAARAEPMYTFGGKDYYGVIFGNLGWKNFAQITSWGIGRDNDFTDGNFIICPTDGTFGGGEARGRWLVSMNIGFGNGGHGVTGFMGSIDGVDIYGNTMHDNGINNEHEANRSPYPELNLSLLVGKNGGGDGEIFLQRLSETESTGLRQIAEGYCYGNIAVSNTWSNISLGGWGQLTVGRNLQDIFGRGNVHPSGEANGHTADGRGAGISNSVLTSDPGFVVRSFDRTLADPRLRSDSPARGAAFLADYTLKYDYSGRRIVDVGAGRCDAGAYQYAAEPTGPIVVTPTNNLQVVLLEGESTSDNNNGFNGYVNNITAAFPNAQVDGNGLNGTTIQTILNEGSKAALRNNRIGSAVLWIGINDIVGANSASNIYNGISQWVQARKAEGWQRVIVVTIHKFAHGSSTDQPGDDARRQALNTLIRQNVGGAHVIADLAGLAAFNNSSDPNNSAFLADGVHMTSAGHQQVSDLVGPLL